MVIQLMAPTCSFLMRSGKLDSRPSLLLFYQNWIICLVVLLVQLICIFKIKDVVKLTRNLCNIGPSK